MTRIAIRADASYRIGSGHVMRCLALADGLQRRGASVSFYVRPRPGDMREAIEAAGFEAVGLGPPVDDGWLGERPCEDAAQMLAALARTGDAKTVVVDHYGLDARWEAAMRPRGVVVVDDLADRDHACDLLVDQNVGADSGDRYVRRAPGARLLLGPRYALLREQFRHARRDRPRDGRVERLLVFMGGFDATGWSVKVTRALGRVRALPRTTLVLPAASPRAAETELACRDAGIEYRRRVDDMAELLAQTDLAIGAGGTASLERAALGVPALALALAPNQRDVVRACVAAGIAISLGDAEDVDEAGIAAAVEDLLSDPGRVAAMSAAAYALAGIDNGRLGTDAVAEATVAGVIG